MAGAGNAWIRETERMKLIKKKLTKREIDILKIVHKIENHELKEHWLDTNHREWIIGMKKMIKELYGKLVTSRKGEV